MKCSFLKTIFIREFFLFFISYTLYVLPCYGIPFKLGFEFQENSSLCPWALHNARIQKKELFSLEDEGKKLGHVVIDTCDIEFVTIPFTHEEQSSLEKSIGTIVHSVNVLREILRNQPAVSFSDWVAILESHDHGPIHVKRSETFKDVASHMIIRPSDEWSPRFAPQVTIQHPLECTIPLYFGLFGFKTSHTMLCFGASIPFRNLFLEYHEEADSQKIEQLVLSFGKKISGLVFLHALTLVQMTPISEEHDDKYFLEETSKTLTDFYQIDAKMRLSLMSRRPFSSMFEDIRQSIKGDYSTIFNLCMRKNTTFMRIFNVPSLFYRTNYAEQFFDEGGQIRPLQRLLGSFQNEFVEHNRERLQSLLENGVISTAMLRNLKEEHAGGSSLILLNNPSAYFESAIDSVEHPEKRYILTIESSQVMKEVPFG